MIDPSVFPDAKWLWVSVAVPIGYAVRWIIGAIMRNTANAMKAQSDVIDDRRRDADERREEMRQIKHDLSNAQHKLEMQDVRIEQLKAVIGVLIEQMRAAGIEPKMPPGVRMPSSID